MGDLIRLPVHHGQVFRQTKDITTTPAGAVQEAAEWLYKLGYPFDWHTDIPPPQAVRDALVGIIMANDYADELGVTSDDVRHDLQMETGWHW